MEDDKIIKACTNYTEVFESSCKKFKKLDAWLYKESNIYLTEIQGLRKQYLKYKRGQVIKVDFGVNIGSELSHTHFAIVLNNDDSTKNDNITVLPLTSKKGYKRIDLGSLIKDITGSKYDNSTYGIVTQIKTISKERILLNNIKHVCDSKILRIIDNHIIAYLTNV